MSRRNVFLVLNLLLFCFLFSFCGQKREIKSCDTFEEMADPTADTLSDWTKVKPGLNVSFVSIDVKYPRSVAPEVENSLSCKLTGWMGEKVSAQLLLWSTDSVNQVECVFEDFKSPIGSPSIEAAIAKARFVRYVMTDVFGEGCGYRKPEDFPASLTPDMLDDLACFDLAGKTVRPVWITIDIPEYVQAAGIYKSKLKITSRNQETKELEIELDIQKRTLPRPSEWAYHLDLWQHPSAVARAQNLELWSDAHFEAMKPLMKMLADAGQKVITTTLNKDPWNNQCYDAYENMIAWTKNADGTWVYDYTVFDRWVSLMMDLGVKKMINCYSMIPWNNELSYKDAASGDTITVKADPGTKIFAEMWTPFLNDFVKHQREKGWLEITNIAIDERSPEEMGKAIEFLQKTAPELTISFADNHNSYKKYPFIKDMCVEAGVRVDSADIAMRREKGLITNYYVCCADKFPNVFTCSDPADAVYSGWYALAAGYDGMLRWAYNSWVENPLTDSRFRSWPAGDTYIVYPEARSSIRFERLIEGIQDVEKIRILRKEFEKANTPESLEKLKQLNDEVAKFNTIEPVESSAQMVTRAKQLINKLSE